MFNEDFCEKIPTRQKLPKMAINGTKIGFSDFFKKIKSLVLSGIGVKQKFLWSSQILWKLHAWKKSGLSYMAQNKSPPFRSQYSAIANISLIDWYLLSVQSFHVILTSELITSFSTSPCFLEISPRFGWYFNPSSGTFEMVNFTMN